MHRRTVAICRHIGDIAAGTGTAEANRTPGFGQSLFPCIHGVEIATPGRMAVGARRMAARHGLSAHVCHALRRIRDSHSQRLTLERLASERGLQTEYIGWLFRHETGRSFRDRLAVVRIRRAARLIRRGCKIEAAGVLSGYRSKKNFYFQFRRRFGVTPGQYRPARSAEGRRPR
jgi:AraC-like DNA-binding protein